MENWISRPSGFYLFTRKRVNEEEYVSLIPRLSNKGLGKRRDLFQPYLAAHRSFTQTLGEPYSCSIGERNDLMVYPNT